MTKLRVTLRDHMTDAPHAHVTLYACAIAVAEWTEIVDVPVDDDGGRGPRIDGPSDVRLTTELVRRMAQHRVDPPVEVTTDGNGVAEFVWDGRLGSPLSDAMRRVQDNRPAGGQPYTANYVGFIVGARMARGLEYVIASARGGVALNDTVSAVVHLDLAWTVVGHVTGTTAKLWFRSNMEHRRLPNIVRNAHVAVREVGESFNVEVRPSGRRPGLLPWASRTLSGFDLEWGRTEVVAVTGLRPGVQYDYRLVRTDAARRRTVVCSGTFRTEPSATTDSVRIGFGSCHEVTKSDSLHQWAHLRDAQPDLVLLMGDQIYGDDVRPEGNESWRDAYIRRYLSSWRHKPMRAVLSKQSVLMMLDDHDVADDWGTTFTSCDDALRIEGAMQAFHAFAGDRNPGPRVRENWLNKAVDFRFSWGFVEGYALDLRTQRGLDSGFPVLGEPQLARFEEWALDPRTIASDVIVVVIPVPLAFLDSEKAAALYRNAPAIGGGIGAGIGAAIGLAGPPGWVFAGGVIGFAAFAAVTAYATDGSYEADGGRVVEPDLADQWDATDNQADLERVLKTLYALANRGDGRIVLLLSGDTHNGSVHRITSTDPGHKRVRRLYQVVSSPISHSSTGKATEMLYASTLTGGLFNYHMVDAFSAELLQPDGIIGGSPLIDEQNVGMLTIARRPGKPRGYDVLVELSGKTVRRVLELRYDLDVQGEPEVYRYGGLEGR